MILGTHKAAVPRPALDPVDRVEEGGRAAVARGDDVDAADVGRAVAVVVEQAHEPRFDGLGAVGGRLGADVQRAYVRDRHARGAKQAVDRGERHRDRVFGIIAKRYPFLPQAGRVLAGGGAVVRLEVGLVNLRR